ncbi:MAG TPA: WecB/TagA/CpsF family glycosyltransferase, partial [Anaerolineales bacterium]|nr:WecB/TagA/CpsF family glycosyltransferase [Anaerolineales bacterium]
MQSDSIIGTRVDAIDYSSAGLQIVDWVRSGKSQYVCVANVHMVMEAYDHPDFQVIVNSAGLVTPDGMPLVWLMRLRGRVQQERVYGPTLMLKLLETADREGVPVGFYGGKPDALESLVKVVHGRYPNLKMVFTFSPPFHELSSEEDANIVERI